LAAEVGGEDASSRATASAPSSASSSLAPEAEKLQPFVGTGVEAHRFNSSPVFSAPRLRFWTTLYNTEKVNAGIESNIVLIRLWRPHLRVINSLCKYHLIQESLFTPIIPPVSVLLSSDVPLVIFRLYRQRFLFQMPTFEHVLFYGHMLHSLWGHLRRKRLRRLFLPLTTTFFYLLFMKPPLIVFVAFTTFCFTFTSIYNTSQSLPHCQRHINTKTNTRRSHSKPRSPETSSDRGQ